MGSEYLFQQGLLESQGASKATSSPWAFMVSSHTGGSAEQKGKGRLHVMAWARHSPRDSRNGEAAGPGELEVEMGLLPS